MEGTNVMPTMPIGGNSNSMNDNPWMPLVYLSLLGNGGFGTNSNVAEASNANATRDILMQGQSNLAGQGRSDMVNLTNQIESQGTASRLDNILEGQGRGTVALTDSINQVCNQMCDRLANISSNEARGFSDVQMAFKDLAMQNANCCCDLKGGQKDIVNAICQQTNAITSHATANTQRIVDQQNDIQRLNQAQKLNDCERQLQTSETVKEITQACGCCAGGSSSSAGTVNINAQDADIIARRVASFVTGK